MSKARIIKLLNILKEKTDADHPLNSEELIPLLQSQGEEVERKTIYSDIKALNDMGIYIESVRGEKSGYYYDGELFENSELRILADAVNACSFITESKSRSTMDKLLSLTNQYNREKIRNTLSYRRSHSTNEQIFYNIDAIGDALFEKKKIIFDYFDFTITGEKKRRRQEKYETVPYAIIWQDERYYLIGFSEKHQGYVHYRIDRMTSVCMLDETRKPMSDVTDFKNGFSLPKHMAEHIYMFSGKSVNVKMVAKKHLMNELVDWFGKDFKIRRELADEMLVEVKCNAEAMHFWALQYGPYVEVLEPAELREEIRESVREMWEKYEA